MDLMPINVLADRKAPPSSPSAAPAKQSFADVLSAHPQSPSNRPAQQNKTGQSQPKVETRKLDRKAKSESTRKGSHKQDKLESQAVASRTADSPIPAPAKLAALSLDLLAASLVSIDPNAAKDSAAVKASPANVTDLGEHGTPTSAAPSDEKVKAEAPKSMSPAQSAHSQLAGTPPAAHVSELGPKAGNGPDPADSATTGAAPESADHLPAKPKSQAAQIEAFKASVAGTVTAHAASAPTSSAAVQAQRSALAEESATKTTNNAQATNPDPSVGALAAAAEKIGTVISTNVRAASKPVAARPMVSALKTGIAAATHNAPALSAASNVAPARSGESGHRHSDTQQQDADPAQLSQSALADTKTPVEESQADPSPSATALGKESTSSNLPAAGSPAAAATPRSGTPSGPAGSAASAPATQQDATALAMNRANIAAGMELSGLSKTSLIERFRQSELHFGMQAGEFGHIEVRTLLDHHEVSARISVEHGDLSRALESELPGLQKRLSDLDLPTARVTLHEQSAAMSGDAGRRSKGQEWQAWQPQPAASPLPSHASMPALLEPTIASEGLSIRI